jgi:hypothetical protein
MGSNGKKWKVGQAFSLPVMRNSIVALTVMWIFPGSAGILPEYGCKKYGKCGQDARAPRKFELFVQGSILNIDRLLKNKCFA